MLSYLIDSRIVVVFWFLRSACSAQRFVLTLTPLPVGNWILWEFHTKKLLTLISSKIKNLKKKGVIRERKNPVVPSLALEDKQVYSEEEDCVAYKCYPQCWICSHRCQFCLKRNDFFSQMWQISIFHILHKLQIHGYCRTQILMRPLVFTMFLLFARWAMCHLFILISQVWSQIYNFLNCWWCAW